uniref:Uncharacterized protein n=1 Tax=Romanomermis culicivorax TaxID=13658 RepID=A0A915K718_ROMCU
MRSINNTGPEYKVGESTNLKILSISKNKNDYIRNRFFQKCLKGIKVKKCQSCTLKAFIPTCRESYCMFSGQFIKKARYINFRLFTTMNLDAYILQLSILFQVSLKMQFFLAVRADSLNIIYVLSIRPKREHILESVNAIFFGDSRRLIEYNLRT